MDNQALQRLKEALGRSQKVAVTVGKNPSVDDMAAALSLYLSLNAMGKAVAVVSPTEPIVEVSNLVGIDKVKTRYEGSGADLVVSFPYKEGEIEKVSYTIENGFLNIVVKAGEQGLTFEERDVKYDRGGSGGGQLDLLVNVGVSRLSDVQGLFEIEMLKDVTVVNIDNKQDNQGYGDIVLVSPRFSSISEQMAQLLSDLGTDPDVDVAQNLLDGINYATENFQSPRTSYLAFEMAGILMRQGAVRARQDARPQQGQPRQQSQLQQPQPFARAHGKPQQQPQRQQHGQDRGGQQFNQPPFAGAQGKQQQRPQPQRMAQTQPMPQPMPQPQLPPEPTNGFDDINPPSDWLTPKVYKGSSNV